MRKKRYADLQALTDAINDGRIRVWEDGNGAIYIQNKRTGFTVETQSCLQYGADSFDDEEPNTASLYFWEN